ncbi:hypothetical protein FQN57_005402 [Myotisia sp. PD_48]|nr:hypothetical protein FQN57_005402 [Myotisia sp. PD_48]
MTLVRDKNYLSIVEYRQKTFNEALQSGEFQPLVFPRDFISLFLLITALLIKWPHHGVLRYGRCFFYCGILYFNISTIKHCRIFGAGNGYGVGLIFSWFSLWSATLMLFTDPQRSFRRIERLFEIYRAEPSNNNNYTRNTDLSYQSNGTQPKCSENGCQSSSRKFEVREIISSVKLGEHGRPQEPVQRFRWQSYPGKQSMHRFLWVWDLTFNFRGPNWNWRVPQLPVLPNEVLLQLDHPSTKVLNDTMIWKEDTKAQIKRTFARFLVYYFALDVLKVVLMKDAYFIGHINTPPPLILEGLCGVSIAAFITRGYRITLSACGVFTTLEFISALNETLMLCISLSPLRYQTRSPIEASFIYPRYFGDILASFLDDGLAGGWRMGWHQFFRYAFVAPTYWLVSVLPPSLTRNPVTYRCLRILQILVAFLFSGLLHASGSYTQWGPSNPLAGPLPFFLAQAVGIIIQRSIAHILMSISPFKINRTLRRTSNLIYALSWLYYSGKLVADDFALGGLWLTEPIPYSFLRAVGFGEHGGSWVCWSWRWFAAWKGEKWWDRGIQVL